MNKSRGLLSTNSSHAASHIQLRGNCFSLGKAEVAVVLSVFVGFRPTYVREYQLNRK